MKCRSLCTALVLVTAATAMTGCHSNKTVVPKAGSGGAVKQDEVGRKWAPPPTPERKFALLDQNQDDSLDMGEFIRNARTPEGRKRETRVFHVVDRNQDGQVSLHEFMHRPAEAGHVYMDANSDGVLTFEEFHFGDMRWAQVEHAQRVFQLMDLDDSGVLEQEEVSSRSTEMWFVRSDQDGDGNGKMSLAEFKLPGNAARFCRLDSDQDKRLSLEEFASDETTAESLARATRVFSAKDVDQDGTLSASEFSVRPKSVKFHENDTNGDGSWSVEEFHQADMKKATIEWAQRTFEKMDRNGDGRLDPDEQASRSPQVWFMFLDGDENGSVSASEYSSFNPWLVESGHCTVVFDLMDENKDGTLTETEFVNKPPEMEFYKRDRSGDLFLSLEEFAIRTGTTAEQTRVFKDKDSDRDGKMSLEEYMASPKKSGFGEMDVNGDGTVNEEEYCRDSLKVSFIRRDGDGDGKLTIAEFLVWSKTPEAIAKAKEDFERRSVNSRDGSLAR